MQPSGQFPHATGGPVASYPFGKTAPCRSVALEFSARATESTRGVFALQPCPEPHPTCIYAHISSTWIPLPRLVLHGLFAAIAHIVTAIHAPTDRHQLRGAPGRFPEDDSSAFCHCDVSLLIVRPPREGIGWHRPTLLGEAGGFRTAGLRGEGLAVSGGVWMASSHLLSFYLFLGVESGYGRRGFGSVDLHAIGYSDASSSLDLVRIWGGSCCDMTRASFGHEQCSCCRTLVVGAMGSCAESRGSVVPGSRRG